MLFRVLTIIAIISLMIGCDQTNRTTTHDEGDEESGQQFTKSETYDMTRRGARLILNFDPMTNLFNGTVENTTNTTLNRVRVEIHLSNGTELGPTKPTDIPAGKKIDIILDAAGEAFDTFSAHPEVG